MFIKTYVVSLELCSQYPLNASQYFLDLPNLQSFTWLMIMDRLLYVCLDYKKSNKIRQNAIIISSYLKEKNDENFTVTYGKNNVFFWLAIV
jgi:hypothetical protein